MSSSRSANSACWRTCALAVAATVLTLALVVSAESGRRRGTRRYVESRSFEHHHVEHHPVEQQTDEHIPRDKRQDDPGYPTYNEVPQGLAFTCQEKKPGYYADPATRCQVWHWCLPSGAKFSFLCPNGTVFNQAVRVCDWAHNVDCTQAESQYSVNDDLYRDKEGNFI